VQPQTEQQRHQQVQQQQQQQHKQQQQQLAHVGSVSPALEGRGATVVAC
jgi:hypothetical protein